jgi:hypothetical protein
VAYEIKSGETFNLPSQGGFNLTVFTLTSKKPAKVQWTCEGLQTSGELETDKGEVGEIKRIFLGFEVVLTNLSEATVTVESSLDTLKVE